jgi:hypothetical protein
VLIYSQRPHGPVASTGVGVDAPSPSSLALVTAPKSESADAPELAANPPELQVNPPELTASSQPRALRAAARQPQTVVRPAQSARSAPRAPTSDPVEVFGARR